jgi:hypothetical protein
MTDQTPSNGYNPFEVATKTIHAEWWGDGATVTVKELTYADEQRLAMAGMKQDTAIPTTKREQRNMKTKVKDLDLERLKLLTMQAGIESWTFKMPITLENLKKLTRKDGEFIQEAIDALNPSVDEEFQD